VITVGLRCFLCVCFVFAQQEEKKTQKTNRDRDVGTVT
jgi:hypothetical protein